MGLRPTLGAPLLSPLAAGHSPSRAAAPLREGTLDGGAPSSPPPIYSGGFGAAKHTNLSLSTQPYLSTSSSSVVLGEALPENHAAPPPPRCRAAVGVSFPNLSLLLAGSRNGRRHRAARVL